MYMYILCFLISNILMAKCSAENIPIFQMIILNVGFNMVGLSCLIQEIKRDKIKGLPSKNCIKNRSD